MVLPLWWMTQVLLFTSCSAHSYVFTSVGQMMDLLLTERQLVTSLKDYIRSEEDKLQEISEQWASRLALVSAAASLDPERFLGHPVNAVQLMKRLNSEWAELESLVLRAMSDVSNKWIHERGQEFRRRCSLQGAH